MAEPLDVGVATLHGVTDDPTLGPVLLCEDAAGQRWTVLDKSKLLAECLASEAKDRSAARRKRNDRLLRRAFSDRNLKARRGWPDEWSPPTDGDV